MELKVIDALPREDEFGPGRKPLSKAADEFQIVAVGGCAVAVPVGFIEAQQRWHVVEAFVVKDSVGAKSEQGVELSNAGIQIGLIQKAHRH